MAAQTYALLQDGLVSEIIPPFQNESGDYVPIDERYVPEFVAQMVDITNIKPAPQQGWTYDAKKGFAAPVAAAAPSETAAYRDGLLTYAALRIAPLQDAVDMGEATSAEQSALTAWKTYRVAVNRVGVTDGTPVWPIQPAA